MAELLLEILSEEIPARMQSRAAEDLVRLVGEGLRSQGLDPASIFAYAGPRRLTIVATDLPTKQPDTVDERKGPQVGAPDGAIRGFLKGSGLQRIEDAEVRELSKGKFYFAVTKKKGRSTSAVVKEVVEGALPQLPWPKSMRWADNPTRWVRPLHGILCVLGGKVVPVRFANVKAGDTTVGHRFLAPKIIRVKGYDDYKAKLKKAFVVIDPKERAQTISNVLSKRAAKENLKVKDDPTLLAEVAGLVEWPVPLIGTIDSEFMDVPPEVLTSAMRKHQKYFALTKKNGKLANRFGVVANMVTKDRGKAIVAGNERVLRARLSDAKFFWDQDRRQKLDSRVEKLGERVFQAQLGTMRDKVERIVEGAAFLTTHVAGANSGDVARAARLCKADLSTGMVGEFPDLQGVMGRYYALHDNEPAAVADAIAEHYAPQGPADVCPNSPVSVTIALADKLDSLVGFFAINEKPTGSKDPYALRRAALGVIRLILENRIRLPLVSTFEYFLGAYTTINKEDPARLAESLLEFFADRLKVHLRDKGVKHDHVSAVFALGGEDDLVRLLARVDALAEFLRSDDGANLLIAYRRAANIVRIEEKKDGASYGREIAPEELGAPDAEALFKALSAADLQVQKALGEENFRAAMAALASLRRPVDKFFDKVTVNTDVADQRTARLGLLSHVVEAMGRIADFSQIEGG